MREVLAGHGVSRPFAALLKRLQPWQTTQRLILKFVWMLPVPLRRIFMFKQVAGGKVELSYKRTDYLEQRHVLMRRWPGQVTEKATTDNVMSLREVRR